MALLLGWLGNLEVMVAIPRVQVQVLVDHLVSREGGWGLVCAVRYWAAHLCWRHLDWLQAFHFQLHKRASKICSTRVNGFNVILAKCSET